MSDVICISEDGVIIRLARAKHELAEAKTIQQTKKIIDVASAAEIYAKQQQLGAEAIEYAHAIKMQALRRLGELLKAMPKATGGQPYHAKATGSESEPVATLADLGINKKISMLAQRLADISHAEFEKVCARGISMAQVLRAASKRAPAVSWTIDIFDQLQRALLHRTIEVAPPGSHRFITDRMRLIADELDARADPDLFDAAAIAKIDLEIHDAEPGGRRFFDDGRCIGGCPSTYPEWYKGLTTAKGKEKEGITPFRRKTVEARVEDIGIGQIATARTAPSHFAVEMAIRPLPRTSPLGRSSYREGGT